MFNPARALSGLCFSHGAGFLKKTMRGIKLFECKEDCKKALETIEAFDAIIGRLDEAEFFYGEPTNDVISFLLLIVKGNYRILEKVKR